MPGGSPVGSQEPGQRGLTPTQRRIATAHQAYREFIGAPSRRGKEFLRGQFLNQFIETGNYDRKATAAEFNAKYNPYAEEEKADAEADQRRKETAKIPPVAAPTDVIAPDTAISVPVESEATVPVVDVLQPFEQSEQPVVPEESPTPRPEVTAPEIVTPTPATRSKGKPFLPSDTLLSGRKWRVLAAAGLKALPGIEALDKVEKQVRLRAANRDRGIEHKKGLIKRGVNFLGRKFFGR